MQSIINRKKKQIIFGLIALAVMGVIYLLTAWLLHYPPFVSPRTPQPGEDIVNLERSDSEKAAEQELKDNPSTKLKNNQTDRPVTPATNKSTGKQQASVLLTSTGVVNDMVSASGFVTNIVEEGGTCTYIFTSGSNEIKKTTLTMVNPSSTTCATTTFPVSELTTGDTWKVYIQYDSAAASGRSNEKVLMGR